MGSKLKGLRRKPGFTKLAPGKASVAGNDGLMLSAAKRCVDQTDGLAEVAQSDVCVVCDVRDDIGAEIASSVLNQTVGELRDVMLPGEKPGEANPIPFVCTWGPRDGLAEMLTALGFAVPPDWAAALARPPKAPGWFWVLLKRDGRGLLLETDFGNVPALPGPALKFGGKH